MNSTAEFVLRALCAQWLLAGAAVSSYALAARLLRGVPATVRWLGVGVAGIWLATVGFHLLAAVGWFTLPPALAAVTLLPILLVPTTPGIGGTFARDRRAVRRLLALARRRPERGVAAALFVCAMPVVLRPLFMPPLAWDTLVYHALKAGLWVEHAGQLQMDAPGPWAVHGELWAGAEVLMAWAMLPFHGDFLAGAGEVVQWLGLGLAVTLLARIFGAREPYASSAAGFVMAVPTISLLVGSGYVEPALCFCFAAALTFALRCLRRPSLGVFVFAVAACALAAGMKASTLPTVAYISAVAALRILVTRRHCLRRLGWSGLAALTAGAVIVPWMAHTYIHTGLPLSPLPVVVAGRSLGASPEFEWYMTRPEIDPGNWRLEGSLLLSVVFGWLSGSRETLRAPSLLPVAVALIGLLVLLRRTPGVALFVLGTLGFTITSYFDPRLTVLRQVLTISSSRFLLPMLVVAVPLSVAWCSQYPSSGRLYVRLLWVLTAAFFLQTALVGMSAVGVQAATMIATVTCVLFSLLRWFGLPTARAFRVPLVALVVCAALFMLSGLRTSLRSGLMHLDFVVHDIPRYWVDAAVALDDPEQPRRFAVTGGPAQNADNWFTASFLGRRLQNDLLYISPMRDGSIPHFGLGDLNTRLVRTADADAWMTRLAAHGITHVLSFSPASVELGWLRERPARFRELYGGSDWGVFEVRR